MIDLTTLEGAGHPRQGARAVRQGDAPRPDRPDRPEVAAVCVYPDLVAGRRRGAARQRASTSRASRPRSRAAGPACRSSSPTPRDAVAAGADEIDMVIDRGAFLSGRYLAGLRRDRRGQGRPAATPTSRSSSRPASWSPTTTCAARPGWRCWPAATSSRPPPARSRPAATLPVTLVMLEAVRDFRAATGARSASSRPAASAPPRTPSSTSCSSTRPPATTGSTRTGSASAPPACSTTC